MREWVRGIVRASGGGRLGHAALYANDAVLDLDRVREMATLSDAEVREAVAGALGGPDPDAVCDALREVVGNVVRREVAENAEAALRSRLGELRRAVHDDAKMAHVLCRIGDDPDAASREISLAALGVDHPRSAAAVLRRSDVRSALAAGRLPSETMALARAIRSPEQRERTEEMFGSAIDSAGRDPFAFAEARYEVAASLAADRGGFVADAIRERRIEDAESRAVAHAASKVFAFAAAVAGAGPIGSAAFGLADVAVARSEAGVQMAGLLAGVSSVSDSREAAIEESRAIVAAGAGLVVGGALEVALPDGWIFRVIGAALDAGAPKR